MTRIALAIAVMIGVVAGASGVARAQPQHQDPNDIRRGHGETPEIILLTFGEGFQIFEKFGHAALCLHYPSERDPLTPQGQMLLKPIADKIGIPVDELPAISCVNYGVTNFAEGPSMIWHFLRTEQKFWADTESMVSMVIFYSGRDALGKRLQEDRDIWVQRLPLDDKGARIIENKLFDSITDERGQACADDRESPRCYYYYDHFFDNCTTRLRGFMDEASGGKLSAGTKDVAYPLTFREMGRRGLAEQYQLIGIADYVLGRQLDDTPTLWEAMFHPDILRDQVRLKLGVEPVMIYQRKGPPFAQDGPTWRGQLFGIALLFAVPLLLATWRRKAQKAALIWATFYLVVWGLLIYTLVAISSIPGVRWNEAVFVMTPLDIVLPFLGVVKRRKYAKVRVGILIAVSLLDVIGVFHQPLMLPVLSAIMPMAIIAFDLPHPLIAMMKKRRGSSAPSKPAEAA